MAAFAAALGDVDHMYLHQDGMKSLGAGFGSSKDGIVTEEPEESHSAPEHEEPARLAGLDDKTIVQGDLIDVHELSAGAFVPGAMIRSSSSSSILSSMRSSLSSDVEGSVGEFGSAAPASLASFLQLGARECANKCSLACGAATLPLCDPGTPYDASFEYAPKRLAMRVMGMLADLGARWVAGAPGVPVSSAPPHCPRCRLGN